MLRKASMQDLSAHLARIARDIGTTLGSHGHRAWIVGGAPRDLALGLAPVEIDMASSARPDEIERLFAHTIPIGRAFGTVVIHIDGLDVQHTTFRSEASYSDARRPDAVAFGASVEEDSSRRDFTCNALYLDPLTDELVDPQHGLDDLAARRLSCVGDPRLRFEEDGLRLLRMARFAAALDLVPGREVLAAAQSARDTLRGVSPERILVELTAIFAKPRAARALELLEQCGLLDRAVPGVWDATSSADVRAASVRMRRVFEALPSPCGPSLGIAALLASSPRAGESASARQERLLARLEIARALRASRALLQRTREILEISGAIEAASLDGARPSRSERLRWMQKDAFAEALDLARAMAVAAVRDARLVEDLARERNQLTAADVHPPALLESDDLGAAGIPRGPAWGALLREAETLQLDQALRSRDEALAWLARNAARAHEGGKTPRKR
jgi:poly(A) polymerase